MVRSVGRVALAAVAVWLAVAVADIAAAQDRRQNQPGQFDFYVLSLSWSPSFCEAAGERGTPPQQQCGARPYSFVVHGLWPQYERGFPEFCQQPALGRGAHLPRQGLALPCLPRRARLPPRRARHAAGARRKRRARALARNARTRHRSAGSVTGMRRPVPGVRSRRVRATAA